MSEIRPSTSTIEMPSQPSDACDAATLQSDVGVGAGEGEDTASAAVAPSESRQFWKVV